MPAATDVAEPVNRVEGLRASAGFRQPCVDEAVAESVRQRIRQHSRQTLERSPVESRKLVWRFPCGHRQGRDLDAGACESRIKLEDPNRARLVPGHGPDASAATG